MLLKKRLKNLKFIYHSHNIEYLLRRKKNNFLISFLTKYFEKYVASKFDIFTSVSSIDQKKIKKLYNINSKILSNGIIFPNINRVRKKN